MCAAAWIGLGLSLAGILMPTLLLGFHLFEGPGLGALWVVWFLITFPHLITAGLAIAHRRDASVSAHVMLVAETVLLAGWCGWALASWLDIFWGFFWIPVLQLLLILLGPFLRSPARQRPY